MNAGCFIEEMAKKGQKKQLVKKRTAFSLSLDREKRVLYFTQNLFPENHLMKKFELSLYWWCQLMGWGSAALFWCYYAYRDGLSTPWFIYNVLSSFIVGIGSTHLYKLFSYRYNWHLLSIRKLLPIMFLGVFSLLIIYTIFNFLISYSIYGDATLDRETLIGMVSGGLRYNAIWVLAFHMYHYARRESKNELEKARLETIAMEAQLHQLNTELNPHFLFNSLNSVKALILENPQAARKALVILSDILRYSLNISKKGVIRLEEELVQIEDYLRMEKIRFEERLEYQLNIAPLSKRAIILPLSLHNLVENAIKHGISKRVNGGNVELKSEIINDRLLLEVRNDGQLIQENSGGLGVKNLKERLQLMYGSEASFSLKNINGSQVTASIQIPLRYE